MSGSVKKGKFMTKFFFSEMLNNEVLKKLRNISTDVKANKN